MIWFPTDKAALDETLKSMETLMRLASNPECVPFLVDGLSSGCLTSVFTACEHSENSCLERSLSQLLNQIVKVGTEFVTMVFGTICIAADLISSNSMVMSYRIGVEKIGVNYEIRTAELLFCYAT